MLMKKLIKNQLGDTIIEVMVVLAVLGLAISISYATANRSLLDARQAQENSQATWLVETQVENLRLLAPNSNTGNTNLNTNIFLQTGPFCVLDPTNPSNTTPIHTNVANCTFPTASYQVLIYNCDKLPTTGPCTNVTGPNVLAVQATWDDALGQGQDTVTLNYRVHPQ